MDLSPSTIRWFHLDNIGVTHNRVVCVSLLCLLASAQNQKMPNLETPSWKACISLWTNLRFKGTSLHRNLLVCRQCAEDHHWNRLPPTSHCLLLSAAIIWLKLPFQYYSSLNYDLVSLTVPMIQRQLSTLISSKATLPFLLHPLQHGFSLTIWLNTNINFRLSNLHLFSPHLTLLLIQLLQHPQTFFLSNFWYCVILSRCNPFRIHFSNFSF